LSDQNRISWIGGAAVIASMTIGVVAFLAAIAAGASGNPVGAGTCLIAAALAFGNVIRAVFA